MCGIVAFNGLKCGGETSSEWLRLMLSMIQCRGPDESGIYFDECVGLGTARLSILDIHSGQQPFSSQDGRYWIVCNGEIFNYLELREELSQLGHSSHTGSDTEVLLRAIIEWDIQALSRLNGQFAFVCYDRRKGRFLAARDRFGERPLFYLRHEGGVVFASEIKAILALPFVHRELNRDGLKNLFHLWANFPGETCFRGIAAVPPGHFAVHQNESWKIEPYFQPSCVASENVLDFEEAKQRLQTCLRESIRMRLRSDVEVGAYLSGGLDSAIVTAIAQEESQRKIRTFSLGFCDKDYDESSYQHLVSQHLGTKHEEITMSRAQIVSSFSDTIWHTESALFRTAPVPMLHLAQLVQKNDIKVVLTGEGADELFWGYNIFKETLFRKGFHDFEDDSARLEKLGMLYPYLAHFSSSRSKFLLGFYRNFTKEKFPGFFSHEIRFANGLFSTQLLKGDYDADREKQRLLAYLSGVSTDFMDGSVLERTQLLEMTTLLSGYLLSSQGDRMTSAHGVEGRYPFLDPQVFDFACSLPLEYKIKDGINEKYILKECFKELLPPEICARPKQPYRAPQTLPFLETEGIVYAEELLSPENVRCCGCLNETAVQSLFSKLKKSKSEKISPREDQAFILLLSTLELHKRFVREFPMRQSSLQSEMVKNIDGRGRDKV